MIDLRIQAIRNNPLIGSGSCSSIDECYTDNELLSELEDDNINTPAEAVKWALRREELFLENGLNESWGEVTDVQLRAYHEFKNKRKNLGY